jgi:hypothetical protein
MKTFFRSAFIALALITSVRAEDKSAALAYPLTTCLVSGEALGSMGETFVHLHKTEGQPDREVRLCCKGCLQKFAKDPAKYIAKLDAAKTPAKP